MARKSALVVGILIILSFNFLCLAHFLYAMFTSRIMYFYLGYVLFLTIVVLSLNLLQKSDLFTRLTSTIMVLVSIAISLVALRQLIVPEL